MRCTLSCPSNRLLPSPSPSISSLHLRLFRLAHEPHDQVLDLHELFSHSLILNHIGPLLLVHLLKDELHLGFQLSHLAELRLFHLNVGVYLA